MFQIIWLFWLLLFELVIVFGWIFSRLPHFIADDLAGRCMLLWTRVLRVIVEVHQDQTWQVTLQMNANHHPGRMCLKELLVVSSDCSRLALYDWQPHCCCIHKQRGSNKTRRWCSRVMNRWLMFHMRCWKNELLPHEGCLLVNQQKFVQQIFRHVCWYFFMLLNDFWCLKCLEGLWLFANFESSRRTYASTVALCFLGLHVHLSCF